MLGPRRGRRQGPDPCPRARPPRRSWRPAAPLPVNLKFVFEGEEESSSVHLDAWLEANRERLGGRPRGDHRDTGFFEGNRARDHASACAASATSRST